MSDGGPLTREEALLALDDHIGQEVEVIVQAGVHMAMVMSAKGTLYHWRDYGRAERWGWHSRENIAGLYDVGGASFDITDLHTAWLLDDEGEPAWGLSFFLAEGAALSVVWGVEPS
jgi:hypothetical protein